MNKKGVSSVTFNDGRCNYHAKSYYCQPIDLSMKPAKGSPASCKCKKVELTSGYSAGMLVRCDQCITGKCFQKGLRISLDMWSGPPPPSPT